MFLFAPAFALAQWSGPWDGDWEGAERSPYREDIEDLGEEIVEDLPIPVLVGVEVKDLSNNFGDPRGGGSRTHEGLDMLALEGSPVASPTEAVVVRVGNGPDSGLYVRTANPGDESFVYMHLSKIAEGLDEGDKVKRGEIIGFVGNTGNASGGPAHLHFEIRQDGAKDPFSRLTEVFTAEEREAGLTQALERGGDEDVLAALSAGEVATPVPQPTAAVPARATVAYGYTNAEIVALQKFLIKAEAGVAARELAEVGATGFFGPLTRAAVREYQREEGLKVTGIVDEETYKEVFAVEDKDEEVAGDETTLSSFVFTRDLEVGVTGDDVRALQVFLNTNVYVLAETGPGSPGNETLMFGALTRAALARYQAANDISPAVGYFGPITRAYILKTASL
ncbi:MAG: peptidoglycan-binding protein [Patescibacteria group bacterium]|nr:peptidoglycan-binding protein [Patescibacteria group bacterium]